MKGAFAVLIVFALIGGICASGMTGEIMSHYSQHLFAQSDDGHVHSTTEELRADDEHVGSTSEELRGGNHKTARDACRPGFVWREAFPGDHVCVVPAVRTQVAHDNALAGARRQPGGGKYGKDTCREGFVWREAIPTDHVCVTPQTRAQTIR